jgi:nicotinate phosphoribosyltransferase
MTPSQRATAEGILMTDEYQLTMAQLYFRMGIHERPAQFDHFFRQYPDYGAHQAGYCINAGLAWLLDWMHEARFRDEDIEYLRLQRTSTGDQLFGDDFLAWLRRNGSFDCINMDAVPEGRVVHPNTPLTVVRGPLAMAQVLETPLLNQLNYQTLIATKAARVRESARGRPLLEFGLRRAQGKGGNAGARATLIGGADFTSNTGLSHILGYPPKGTHAHSMVQAFMAMGEGELGAFRAYAEIYPDDCMLLVDTIDTLGSGVPNAIRVFEELRRRGHEPVGVRLDSGDLAYLSVKTAQMLDKAGFPMATIVLSGDLDELVIWQILRQIEEECGREGMDADAVIGRLTFGVGTRLITSEGQPALGGVYKLVAVENDAGELVPAIKVSDTPAKVPNPGDKRLWRLYDQRGHATADLLALADEDPRQMDSILLRHPVDHTAFRTLARTDVSAIEPLLVPVLREGKRLHETPTIEEMRQLRIRDLERLDVGVRRLINPHIYHVSLSQRLWDLKQDLVAQAVGGRGNSSGPPQPA